MIVVVKISYLSATRARTMNLPQRYTRIYYYIPWGGGGGGGGFYYRRRTYKGLAFFVFFRSDPSWQLHSVSAEQIVCAQPGIILRTVLSTNV